MQTHCFNRSLFNFLTSHREHVKLKQQWIIKYLSKANIFELKQKGQPDPSSLICKTHNSFTTNVNDLVIKQYHPFFFQVKRAVQQTGYLRVKRGFKPKISGVPVSEIKLKLQSLDEDKARAVNVKIDGKSPTDPLFKKEWYLVSIT